MKARATALLLVSLVALAACRRESAPPPHLVLILADDLNVSDLDALPAVRRRLQEGGTRFASAFVTTPLCCPSRATLLTGRYAHNHGVVGVGPPDGGAPAFRDQEGSTLATWLQARGYRTALFGKYFNAYPRARSGHVPAGWDEWFALHVRSRGPLYFGYSVQRGERVATYAKRRRDYQTDVLARQAVAFVERATKTADGRPFFLLLAPSAPHLPAEPAPRHRALLDEPAPPPPPSFDEADVADKPAWVRSRPRLDERSRARLDSMRRRRRATLAALDEAVETLFLALERSGELRRTWVWLTSDNGLLLGEHRLGPMKSAPYREAVEVPLLVRGPGVAAGAVRQEIALNLDLAPTLAALAGADAPGADGRSLLPLLGGAAAAARGWRDDFLIEHRSGSGEADVPSYRALRTTATLYVEYATGEREYYDLEADPHEMDSRHARLSPARRAALAARLAELAACAGGGCRE
jgi:arylsulfatase A-like enzyme